MTSLFDLYAAGNRTQRSLAKQFGVTQRAIWGVIHDPRGDF